MSIEQPTNEQMLDEDGLKCVERVADDSWRHGSYISQVFHRQSDNTYWAVSYELSTDGETHGLRDGDFNITQVYPHEVVSVVYKSAKPD